MLKPFDFRRIVAALDSVGAASTHALDEELRTTLELEANGYSYAREAEVVGRGERVVRQQMASFEAFPAGSAYLRLKEALQDAVDHAVAGMEPDIFATRPAFNSTVLQKYEAGSIGITPHRDGRSYINLICVFVIAGRGRFYVCADRAGNNRHEIDASPGSMIMLRAPGFRGSEIQPFHYVTDIPETRYTFGLRQRRT